MVRIRTPTEILYNMSLLLKYAASDETVASSHTPVAIGTVETVWLVDELCLPLTVAAGGKSHKQKPS